MRIRQSRPEDLEEMLRIYEIARRFMAEQGNPHQWGDDNYPAEELLKEDIREQRSYICEEDGAVVGTFCYWIGEEPSYREIREGEWMNDQVYGVIHRIASDGRVKGIGSAVVDWCLNRHKNLRIDTHEKNLVMRNLFRKKGFTYCGKITVDDGTERFAYQKILES
ncbi:GNAT family N-acetyltransferase [Hominifimenecus sp. rT4P-3]|uniref:GNAT family N-acetyltransferase n=1 Tax=Hominifimenecus sp. rT4P-3 TaxID=3242979 RepID=UPI003DA45D15